jgi:hypothetical protein
MGEELKDFESFAQGFYRGSFHITGSLSFMRDTLTVTASKSRNDGKEKARIGWMRATPVCRQRKSREIKRAASSTKITKGMAP